MKTMTCKQLGGACDEAFSANTFDEIVNMSKNHGMKMFKQKDKRHLDAMEKLAYSCKIRTKWRSGLIKKKKSLMHCKIIHQS